MLNEAITEMNSVKEKEKSDSAQQYKQIEDGILIFIVSPKFILKLK